MFAPVYYPADSRSRHQRHARKKRRLAQELDDRPSSDEGTDVSEEDSFVPVNRSDPYLVAGYSREKDLPPYPFPHAAVDHGRPAPVALDEELVRLNPPVHHLPAQNEAALTKRQHLDNLAVLLHRSVSKGDWNRASRIMGLLLRSEYNFSVDLRLHARWTMAAEILMHREEAISRAADQRDATVADKDDAISPVNLQGLKAARAYYERLALQYPHTPRTLNSFSALTLYPSLFNIWIYEVQLRSKMARHAADSRPSTPFSVSIEADDAEDNRARLQELEEAHAIATRLDELLLSPPYDTNPPLLSLRANVALWLADLHTMATSLGHDPQATQQQIHDERARSEALLRKISEIEL